MHGIATDARHNDLRDGVVGFFTTLVHQAAADLRVGPAGPSAESRRRITWVHRSPPPLESTGRYEVGRKNIAAWGASPPGFDEILDDYLPGDVGLRAQADAAGNEADIATTHSRD